MVIELSKFDASNIHFKEPKKVTHAKGFCHKIEIVYNLDGKNTECCIATNQLKSYGIQECKKDGDTGPAQNYSLSLVVDDTETYTVLESIFEACRRHLSKQSVKKAVAKFNMVPEMVDPFYRRHNGEGELVVDAPPCLYPKLLTVYRRPQPTPFTESPKIATAFYDTNDNPIEAESMFGARSTVVASIVVKEIYIGATPAIQLKADEVVVVETNLRPARKLGGVIEKLRQATICVLDSNTATDEATDDDDTEPTQQSEKSLINSTSTEESAEVKTRLVRRKL